MSKLSDQTDALIASISGVRQRDTSQLEERTQAVLRNLQGHRDNGEPLTSDTEQFLLRAAMESPAPLQVQRQMTKRTIEFARKNPRRFMRSVMSAISGGVLSSEAGLQLLGLNDDPLVVAARQQLEAEVEQNRTEAEAERQREEDWLERQRLLVQGILQDAQELSPEQEPKEPELKPERPSAFEALVDGRTQPRRILKKLRLPKRGKGDRK